MTVQQPDSTAADDESRTSAAVRPPVLRTAEDTDRERRATWTELFFDLVFVVAVSRTNELLAADQSLLGALWFAGVFAAVAWSWSNFVMYAERFDTDDVVHRLSKAAAMFAVGAVAFAAPTVRTTGAVGFAAAYLALRLVLVGLYLRAWRHLPDMRHASGVYVIGFGAGAACWALSLVVPSDARPLLWLAGGAIELLTPVAGWRRFGAFAAAEDHLEDRSGLFTLVVLGNAVAGLVTGLDGMRWDATLWAAVVAAALLVLCLWWLTFDFVEVGAPGGTRGLAYVYSHLPVYGAIAAFGVGMQLVVESAPEAPLAGPARWILCGAGASYLLGVAGIRASADPHRRALALHPLAAAALLGLAVLGRDLSGPIVLLVVSGVLATELLHKARLARRQDG